MVITQRSQNKTLKECRQTIELILCAEGNERIVLDPNAPREINGESLVRQTATRLLAVAMRSGRMTLM